MRARKLQVINGRLVLDEATNLRGKLIQRMLMKKTRCHVYYFHDQEQAVIEVHAVWGARRKRGPR